MIETEGRGESVVCAGETMVAFVAGDHPRAFTAHAAGAESNTAIGLARLGVATRWVSRVGDDPLGRMVTDDVGEAGVVVDVEVDGERPTGVLIRTRTGEHPSTTYLRRGSAGSALGPADVRRIGSPAWVHVTGITPALSGDARRFIADVVGRRGHGAACVSFDLNFRPALWPDAATAARVLTPIASLADVVFVGDDEADLLYGTTDPDTLAARFDRGGDRHLVLKAGSHGAAYVTADAVVHQRALPSPVVDVTGAGDGFAAGYIAASLGGWSPTDRLRLAHVVGARVVAATTDHVPPFSDSELRHLGPALLAEWFVD
jgi:2-dehydro-3-deoxygluconokinase